MVSVKLAPIGMIGDHQRQLDALLARPRAHPHPARGEGGHRIGQPARPAVGDGGRRRQHDLALHLVALGAGRRPQLAETHAERFVQRAAFGQRAVQIDRPLIARLAQQRDQALAFAEPIDADDMGAVGKLRARLEQLRHFLARIAVLEHRQREGRLGDEQVAGDELEAGAGRVGAPLVIAGDDGARALPFDQHLRAAEHMAGGIAASPPRRRSRSSRRKRPPGCPWCAGVPSRVCITASVSRVASTWSMPRPRVVGMAMRDDGALGSAIRVDMEAAGAAIEALAIDREPGVESLGSHFFLAV